MTDPIRKSCGHLATESCHCYDPAYNLAHGIKDLRAPASEPPRRKPHPYEASPHSQYEACHVCGRPETSPVHDIPASEPFDPLHVPKLMGASEPEEWAWVDWEPSVSEPTEDATTPSEDEIETLADLIYTGISRAWRDHAWSPSDQSTHRLIAKAICREYIRRAEAPADGEQRPGERPHRDYGMNAPTSEKRMASCLECGVEGVVGKSGGFRCFRCGYQYAVPVGYQDAQVDDVVERCATIAKEAEWDGMLDGYKQGWNDACKGIYHAIRATKGEG